MTAGAANGWRHIVWDPVNFRCKGAPYTVHPMFSTAAPPYPNGQPRAWAMWTAHTYNVAMSDEIGHFEKPDKHADGGTDETPCYPGPYIRGCIGSDFDFDGYSLPAGLAGWQPEASGAADVLVASIAQRPGPLGQRREGHPLRDGPAGFQPLSTCDLQGNGCQNPPPGAAFYPWFHLVPAEDEDGGCAWTLSDDLPRQLSNFGGERAAWGPIEFTDFGLGFVAVDNFASAVQANPCPGHADGE